MASGGQTINDRLNAVMYALVGQGLARTVCKATTEEVLGPKKKHIEYLIACTNEPNVSIPQLANLLIERTQHTSWAVVFKALTTIHHLMIFGNERFNQYLATSNHSFELNDFMDRATPQGYNMSNFVRRYAKYVNSKSISYRTLAIDLCKVKPGNDNALRTMNMDNLSKSLPIVQAQFDALLEFNGESKDLNNGVIMAAFRLLYKDLNRLYVTYQEAIINLVERYFKLSRKKTREALEMYRTFLNRMDKIADFFKVVESVGLDKCEMPELGKFKSLLSVLEDHLGVLEAKKRGSTTPVNTTEGESSSNKPASDKETDSNKENATPTKPNAVEQKPEEKKSRGGEAKEASQAPASAPPPKPARPSPKASPKGKEVEKAGSSGAGAAPEKKAPPERPAKPPSRPPPPSTSSPVQNQHKGADGSKPSRPETSSSSGRPTPPPHPPPPTHPASSSVSPPSASTRPKVSSQNAVDPKPATAECNNHNDQPTENSNNADSLAEEPPTSGGSCSASAVYNQQENDKDDGQTELESNHVSDNNQPEAEPQPEPQPEQADSPSTPPPPPVEEEEEMPAPPPPIDDEEPPANNANELAQEESGQQLNGTCEQPAQPEDQQEIVNEESPPQA